MRSAPFTAIRLFPRRRLAVATGLSVVRGSSDFPPAQGCEPCPLEADGLMDFIVQQALEKCKERAVEVLGKYEKQAIVVHLKQNGTLERNTAIR